MNIKKWLLIALPFAVLGGYLLYLQAASLSPSEQTVQRSIDKAAVPNPAGVDDNASASATLANFKLSQEEKEELAKTLLNSTPEQKKTAVATLAYMSFINRVSPLLKLDKPNLSMADMLSTFGDIDLLQKNNYFTLGDAFNMKAQLLRSQYSGDELAAQIQDLRQSYQAQANALAAQSDPTKDPIYIQYKAAENAIIEQANTMNSFPNGESKEQYIITESEKVRLKLYR